MLLKVFDEYDEEIAKRLPTKQSIVAAVEALDITALAKLIPERRDVYEGLEQVFKTYREQGVTSLTSSPSSCSCMFEPHEVVGFYLQSSLTNGKKVLEKEFAFVFTPFGISGVPKFVQFCAHLDWKQKHKMFVR